MIKINKVFDKYFDWCENIFLNIYFRFVRTVMIRRGRLGAADYAPGLLGARGKKIFFKFFQKKSKKFFSKEFFFHKNKFFFPKTSFFSKKKFFFQTTFFSTKKRFSSQKNFFFLSNDSLFSNKNFF